MIQATDIYNATHQGLDIILYYYPQAEHCVDNKKKFKRRPDEDDASACIRLFKDCYKVTDFGDSGTAMSPIDICMYEENIRFPEAVMLLASRYNVSSRDRSINRISGNALLPPTKRKVVVFLNWKNPSLRLNLISSVRV